METKHKNIITKIANVVLIVGIVLIGCLAGWRIWTNLHVESPVTIDQAIEIGKVELKQRGYPAEDMRVEADENNSLWQESITKNPSKLQSPIVKRLRLEEKKYWAIYYAPKENSLGGDAWIFVDINTGEIIGVILGE